MPNIMTITKIGAYLVLAALELVEQTLHLHADVEVVRVEHDEDDVGAVDEPLADVVEGVDPAVLAALHDARHVHHAHLSARRLQGHRHAGLVTIRYGRTTVVTVTAIGNLLQTF